MEECFQGLPCSRQETDTWDPDTWAPAYIEIDGIEDVTDMVLKALQASGFT